MNQTTLGIIRHVLTFGGGLIVAKGWSDNGTVETVIGALVTLVGAVWSIIQKRSV